MIFSSMWFSKPHVQVYNITSISVWKEEYKNFNIKGNAIVVKVDENIAEIKFKDNDFFRDIDIGDFVILYWY